MKYRTAFKRFWSKVQEDPMTGCWIWTASTTNGYGQFGIDGGLVKAHRFAFRQFVGSIPSWLQIDHLCRNRACVNPIHMELVTCQENVLRGEGVAANNARKIRCLQGHLYDEINTYVYPDGRRQCRTCRQQHMQKWRTLHHVADEDESINRGLYEI